MSGAETSTDETEDDDQYLVLVAKLVDPTRNKREKLAETQTTYRDALADAFEQGCDTQSATNDVVVDYELSGYAKNALKQYVPQLVDDDTYGANDLADDHPVRFTNEGPDLDHQPQNHYEWNLKLPHHEDYNLWCPLAINPEQERWYRALFDDESSVQFGETRLSHRDGEWYAHITVKHEPNPPLPAPEDATVVGVDVGEASLLTVCHRDECGSPTDPTLFVDEAKQVRQLRKEYFSTAKRLRERGSTTTLDAYSEHVWNRIDDILHTVTRRVIDELRDVENPVLVLEDLTYIREEMDYGAFMNRRLHGWAFATLHALLTYKARDAGIPVRDVDPWGTSKKCHACGSTGYRPRQSTLKCTNDDCWVSEYHADVNAAVDIADTYRTQLYDLAGETRPRKHSVVDDSGEDGAPLTVPQDSSASEDHSTERRASDDNVGASRTPGESAGSRRKTGESHAS